MLSLADMIDAEKNGNKGSKVGRAYRDFIDTSRTGEQRTRKVVNAEQEFAMGIPFL